MGFQKMKLLKESIEKNINEMELENAEMLLDDYEKLNSDNLDIFMYKAIIKFYNQEYEEAEKLLQKGLKLNKFNFDLNYNLAIVLECMGKYFQALKQYVRTNLLAGEEFKSEIDEKITVIIDIILKENKEIKREHIINIINSEVNKLMFSNTNFPNYTDSESYFGKFFKDDYFVAEYDKYAQLKDGISFPYNQTFNGLHCIEMIKSEKTDYKKYDDSEKKIIPICALESDTNIKITDKDNTYIVKNRLPNRFYYYTVNGQAEITGKNLVIGREAKLKRDENKKRLVLNIFIDGLSQAFLEEQGFENIMPYTYKFFSEGCICNNAYTTAEWTLPSVACIHSGKYTFNHGIYHPRLNTEISSDNKVLSQLFNEAGYFTSKIDGNWRTVPTYGYYRGVDRTLYKESVRSMGVEEIVSEIIEQLYTYKESNQFIWTCAFDLHDVVDDYDLKMSANTNTDLEYLKYDNDALKVKSVHQVYDESKKNKYMNQIKRIDLYLGLLYNFINENYKEEDILISLISDHGQSYLIPKGDPLLSPERTKIPMMFRGNGVKKGICNELIETIDFGKIISKISGVPYDGFGNDSNLPVYFGGNIERGYTYTELLYPGQSYNSAINFTDYLCVFETESPVNNDGRFRLDEFKLTLIHKKDRKEFKNEEKYNQCLEIIMKYISKLIIY